jgi:hypothetical protein
VLERRRSPDRPSPSWRHPEIAIHRDAFAAMCIAELRRLAEAQSVEADALQWWDRGRRQLTTKDLKRE